MRVTVKHRTKTGLLPSTQHFYVDCTILFSEEEKAIVKARGLGGHYIVVDPEMLPPIASHWTAAKLLKALAPLLFLAGCVTGLGMTFAGNGHGGDALTGMSFFTALAMFLGGMALNRHLRAAEQPQQIITLSRLLNSATFSVYAIDNARAKIVHAELTDTLTRLKQELLTNRDILTPETFEL